MKAYELLDSPEKWCVTTFALDANGYPVTCNSIEAACWCPLGALIRCYPDYEAQDEAHKKLMAAVGGAVIPWNARATFEQVREALIKADV